MDKMQRLLDRENYLLKEIEYFEKRIELAKKQATNSAICYDSDSSDSENEIKLNNEPSLLDLKHEKKKLQTCLLATAELTDVAVIQSEINFLSDDPVFDRESPVVESGIWKETIAECRIGMVTFTIHFLTHEPYRLFGPTLFRNLQVLPIKKPQEVELSSSVLSRVSLPSHAIQVLKSYETAYRSRRSTLAKLSDKYGEFVSMECKVDGGYIIRCDGILSFSWFLQNKYSYLSCFQHKMSFDLEYIDESYVKIIRKANKKLENQSIQTEERTQLLSAIIETCLQAKGVLENHSESENERIQHPSQEENQQIMAPPKIVPKKLKKNKENLAQETASASEQFLKENGDDEPLKKKDINAKDKKSNFNDNTENGGREINANVDKIKNVKPQAKTKEGNSGHIVLNSKKTVKNGTVIDKDVASDNKIPENVKSGKFINKNKPGKSSENYVKQVGSKNNQNLEGDVNIEEIGDNRQNKKRKIDLADKFPVKKIKTNVASTVITDKHNTNDIVINKKYAIRDTDKTKVNIDNNKQKTTDKNNGANKNAPIDKQSENIASEKDSVKRENSDKVINKNKQGEKKENGVKGVGSKNQNLDGNVIEDSNKKNKKRKIDLAEKLPVKKMKANVTSTDKQNTNKDNAVNIKGTIGSTLKDKSKQTTTDKNSVANKNVRSDKPGSVASEKHNQITGNGNTVNSGKVINENKPGKNTENGVKEVGSMNNENKTSVANKNAQTDKKLASVAIEKVQAKVNPIETQIPGSQNGTRKRTPNKIDLVQRTISIGSGGKSMIPQKKRITPLQATATQIKSSSLGVNSSKQTHIPIAKRA